MLRALLLLLLMQLFLVSGVSKTDMDDVKTFLSSNHTNNWAVLVILLDPGNRDACASIVGSHTFTTMD